MNHTLKITYTPPNDYGQYQDPYLAYCTACGHNTEAHTYTIETWWKQHLDNTQQQETNPTK